MVDIVERNIILNEVQQVIWDSICTEGQFEGWIQAEPLMEKINELRKKGGGRW